jgi:UTP:GlnB (protein PII) uridylyltransferase
MHTVQSSHANKKTRLRARALEKQRPAASETTVRILKGEDGQSVLEVETSDRSGFMGGLSLALLQHSVQILRAEVRRVGAGAVDRFILAERDGSPISAAKWLALQVVVLSAIEAAVRAT